MRQAVIYFVHCFYDFWINGAVCCLLLCTKKYNVMYVVYCHDDISTLQRIKSVFFFFTSIYTCVVCICLVCMCSFTLCVELIAKIKVKYNKKKNETWVFSNLFSFSIVLHFFSFSIRMLHTKKKKNILKHSLYFFESDVDIA